MADNNLIFTDPATGIKTFYGSIERTKGEHSQIPSGTDDNSSMYVRGFFRVECRIPYGPKGDADEREFLQYHRP